MHAVLRVDLQPRLAVLGADDLVDAGRAITGLRAAVLVQFTSIATAGSRSCRCAGWFSSWLVLLMNTDDRRSKVSLPSGLG